jgi:two-component system response regulator
MNSTLESSGAIMEVDMPEQPSRHVGPVIIVDDDSADAMLAEGVIDELQPKLPVQILTSGEDFISYLKGEGLYHDRVHYPYPGLVLLDLKMPGMDGFAVLEWLKANAEHSKIPVVVLSGFLGMAAQVTRAYQLGARSFLPKPVQQADIESLLTQLNISV